MLSKRAKEDGKKMVKTSPQHEAEKSRAVGKKRERADNETITNLYGLVVLMNE